MSHQDRRRGTCVGDQDKAEFSLGMKSAEVWDMEIGRVKKFCFFIKKLFTKL